MNTILNINRLGLLFKRYFIENKQREITFWGITTVVFTLFHISVNGSNQALEMYLYISGFIFAARSFNDFQHTPNGMHLLLIPATHLEKTITVILLSTFYFFAMSLMCYIIGSSLGTTIGNLIFDTNNAIQFSFITAPAVHFEQGQLIQSGSVLWDTFIGFAGVQALFILGSVYFKGNTIGKTILSMIAVFFVLGLVQMLLLKVLFGSYQINGHMFITIDQNGNNMFASLENILTIFKYALIPFFWVVTYFRLTEKEV